MRLQGFLVPHLTPVRVLVALWTPQVGDMTPAMHKD